MINEVEKRIPANVVHEITYEGAEIVVYTHNKDFFLNNEPIISQIVSELRVRVFVRAAPSLCKTIEEAETIIKKIVPDEVVLSHIHFEPEMSIVYLDVLHPELFYANAAQLIKEIRANTFWTPEITRLPSIKSSMTNMILSMLRGLPKKRKVFLKHTGQQIYADSLKKLEYVRLTCLGGFRQVGRSCLLFQTNTSDILMDCGIDVGYNDKQMLPIFNTPGFNIGALKAIVITHAHLDHVGALPLLFKYGYNGAVYCTEPVRDQMVLALLDQLDLAKYSDNVPLFREEDIRKLIIHTICLPCDLTTNIAADVKITLKNAGHALGSAMVSTMFFGENTAYSVLYSGDIKYGGTTRLLEKADSNILTNDTLIIESTYGGEADVHEADVRANFEEVENNLISIINKTITQKGNVIIPVLASGRAQDIMLVLSNYYRKTHHKIKVYLDGMLWDITAIHTAYPEFLSETFQRQMRDGNPFLDPIFVKVSTPGERENVIGQQGVIVLATAGMMNGGPVLEYFKKWASNPLNSLIFVNYQGANTLGKAIQGGVSKVTIPNNKGGAETIDIQLQRYTLSGFSGHADHKDILSFIQSLSEPPKRIIINHGEFKKAVSLSNTIYRLNSRKETVVPRPMDSLSLFKDFEV
ncbi:MAG: beta-CASP ribonuclease aCPSF1 [Candidatus Huberarchaeum crystalense]|nr:beta-CASP ribonuclease aCPSF1 [archaeon]OIP20627.1 MAG: hypothetical protein AUJ91_00850 [archaeon CG2_30_31_98]PIN66828.1 MAG: beta-CASP ribonuclease aCPSF1 [Candidatus Huberarchaeum crystalense]NCS98246.1 beta-CASP ribonuclease aCPSF1 [archaeon]PIV13654.1 MAG: beta-CASP ribonuclease aCPSF1 [Candidatus Huberarchaeum crystalense]